MEFLEHGSTSPPPAGAPPLIGGQIQAPLSGQLSAQPTEGFHSCFLLMKHITADCLPAGYIRFERWNSKPFCKDAGQDAYGVVEYPRALTIQEMSIFCLKRSKI